MAEEPKGPTGPKDGNPGGNPSGNPDANIKALQQKLSEKDVELKKAQADLEAAKKSSDNGGKLEEIQKLNETVATLSKQIGEIGAEREREKLATKYPDILPELLVGKTEADQERIVKAQRDLIASRNEGAPSAHAPQYKDASEIDKAMEAVKADRSITTEEKMAKLRELKLRRSEF